MKRNSTGRPASNAATRRNVVSLCESLPISKLTRCAPTAKPRRTGDNAELTALSEPQMRYALNSRPHPVKRFEILYANLSSPCPRLCEAQSCVQTHESYPHQLCQRVR